MNYEVIELHLCEKMYFFLSFLNNLQWNNIEKKSTDFCMKSKLRNRMSMYVKYEKKCNHIFMIIWVIFDIT